MTALLSSSPALTVQGAITDREYALALDQADDLAPFREEFVIADPGLIYLDGNSLGRLPKRTAARLREVVEGEWGERLIRGWGEGWFEAPQRVGGKIARLLGASEDEVLVTDSTTVNLFKLVTAALQYQAKVSPRRRKVVTDDLNFPSDHYVIQGVLSLLGAENRCQVVAAEEGVEGPAALAEAIDGETALVALTHTAYRSGYVYDMQNLTARAHAAGALVLWDLCHSAGALPLYLDAAGADLAAGCTYKYLNGGPGSPAFLFVRRGLQPELESPIWGWFGQKGQFDFKLEYSPGQGMQRFLAGTPGILSLIAVECGVDLLLEAGLERLRAKSVALTEYLISLWEALLASHGFKLNSPRNPAVRGSHVALGHPEALRIDRALIEEMRVIPDFRAPDNLRLGVAPLYTSFVEVYEGMRRLEQVMVEGRWEKYGRERPDVT